MICLSAVVLTNSGCFALLLGGAAGAAGVVYIQGVLEQNFDRNIKDVHEAALKTMKAQEIYVSSDVLNYADAEIKGEYEDGEAVTVNVKALTEKSSKLKIRVGVFGDEIKSNVLMRAIEKKL